MNENIHIHKFCMALFIAGLGGRALAIETGIAVQEPKIMITSKDSFDPKKRTILDQDANVATSGNINDAYGMRSYEYRTASNVDGSFDILQEQHHIQNKNGDVQSEIITPKPGDQKVLTFDEKTGEIDTHTIKTETSSTPTLNITEVRFSDSLLVRSEINKSLLRDSAIRVSVGNYGIKDIKLKTIINSKSGQKTFLITTEQRLNTIEEVHDADGKIISKILKINGKIKSQEIFDADGVPSIKEFDADGRVIDTENINKNIVALHQKGFSLSFIQSFVTDFINMISSMLSSKPSDQVAAYNASANSKIADKKVSDMIDAYILHAKQQALA